jgi:small subunit ribosomal protein S4
LSVFKKDSTIDWLKDIGEKSPQPTGRKGEKTIARYIGPLWKKSRRLQFSLLESGKELKRRPFPPGQHGNNPRKKLTEYGLQLREKQRIRFMYGLGERQLSRIFDEAKKQKGVAGTNALLLLESRLDNLVYRMGFSSTRRGARQLVNHGHVEVDGRRVNIPSFRVKPGQTIEIRERSKKLTVITDSLETAGLYDHLTVDKDRRKGVYERYPERSELNPEINEQLVVEFYSR